MITFRRFTHGNRRNFLRLILRTIIFDRDGFCSSMPRASPNCKLLLRRRLASRSFSLPTAEVNIGGFVTFFIHSFVKTLPGSIRRIALISRRGITGT